MNSRWKFLLLLATTKMPDKWWRLLISHFITFQLIKTFVNIVFFHKLDLFCFYVLTNVFMSWNVMKWDIKSLHHLSGIFVVANNKRNFHLEFIVLPFP